MNREHKYRVWDDENKIMLYDFEDTNYAIRYENGTLFCGGYANNKDWKELELLEFTGLKDKFGIEICEGDILRINESGIRDMADPDPHMRVVKWSDKEGRLTQFRIDGSESGSGWTFCRDTLSRHYQVIGNIYENPELLNQPATS